MKTTIIAVVTGIALGIALVFATGMLHVSTIKSVSFDDDFNVIEETHHQLTSNLYGGVIVWED